MTSPPPERPSAPPRASLYLVAGLIAIYGLYGVVAILHTRGGVAPGGAPAFYDFSVFYQAARFALEGRAADAYDVAHMLAAQAKRFPLAATRLPWSYPPTLQLLIAPIAALPYRLAWVVWTGAGAAALTIGLGRIAPSRRAGPWALAPAAFVNVLVGQTGLFAAGAMSGAFAALATRPILAGALLGLLALKPQLALLAPVAIIFAGRWRALASLIAVQIALGALALAILGPGVWTGFANTLLHPDHVFTGSSSSWRAIPSALTLARTLGAGPVASGLAQAAAIAAALLTILTVFRRSEDAEARAAAFGVAAVLATPYLRAYDLSLLIPAAAYVWRRGGNAAPWIRRGAAALAWGLPAALTLHPPEIQYGVLVSLALAACVVWTARQADQARGSTSG